MISPAAAHGPRTFQRLSLLEAIEQSKQRDPFLVDHLVCSTLTLLYGPPLSGKSTLAALLAGAALTGSAFLGQSLTRPIDNVVLMTTEVDGPEEYGRRLVSLPGINPGDDRIAIHPVGALSGEQWRIFAGEVQPSAGTLLVVDNLTQIAPGSINEDAVIREVLSGIRQFTASGAAVVLLAHVSEKTAPYGPSTKPMGNTAISAGARWRVRTVVKKAGAVIELVCDGNGATGAKIILERGAGETDLEVVDTLPAGRAARERDQQAATNLARIADWAVEKGQGRKPADMARLLAETFPELATAAKDPARQIARYLSSGRKIGGFLQYEGNGVWRRDSA